ncbi:ABC transporter permease [bacterium]|nr:ABC transporter permease [bacterium]
MRFELFIAKRYLRARRRTGFINSTISIAGVTIGVAALIIVLSVMNGFKEEVQSRIIGFDTHIRVRKWHFEPINETDGIGGRIRDIPHIQGVSPYIQEKGLIRNGKYSDGILVRGADPETVRNVSDLEDNIVDGKLELGLVPREGAPGLPGIVLGRYLADRMYLNVGDPCLLISLTGMHSMFQVPPMEPFMVTGLFETGFYEFDNTYVYVSKEAAQRLFNYGTSVTGYEVRLDDLNEADGAAKQIMARLRFPYTAETWFELRQNLFSWIQLEKIAAFVVLCLIILVAASNIVSTLIMLVIEKTKEIGILKSMGASSKNISRIFLLEGVVVGVIGTFSGCLIGFILCWIQMHYQLLKLPGDVYFINALPVRMQILDFIVIAVAGVLICLLAAVYPAQKASRLNPVDAIRYE